jgi:hypothetical protein
LRTQLTPARGSSAHRRDGRRHRAEVDRDVLGLHHELAAGVEQRARRVAALLDVGRVRWPDQHARPSPRTARAQRAAGDAQRYRVHRSIRIVPDVEHLAAPALGDRERRLGQLDDRRAIDALARAPARRG